MKHRLKYEFCLIYIVNYKRKTIRLMEVSNLISLQEFLIKTKILLCIG